ncbi:PH domain-containing protein [Chloroflexota bacterium]
MVRTFDITPASSTPLIVISVIGIVLVLLLGLFIFIGYSARNTKFEVSDQGLRIKGGIYGRFIPKEEITAENIQILDLNAYPAYQPRIRTNGVGLPGYAEGWFKLKNNEKALLFVTDRSNVVYIPTRQDYSVMLSVSNPEEFYQTTELWK